QEDEFLGRFSIQSLECCVDSEVAWIMHDANARKAVSKLFRNATGVVPRAVVANEDFIVQSRRREKLVCFSHNLLDCCFFVVSGKADRDAGQLIRIGDKLKFVGHQSSISWPRARIDFSAASSSRTTLSPACPSV